MVCVMQVHRVNGAESMLRITTERKRRKTVLNVEGRLAGPWVSALEQCWRELHAASPQDKFHVDLCGVSFIDSAGRMLLREIHQQGGTLIAEGCLNQAVVQDIVRTEKGRAHKDRQKGSHIVFYIALFSLLLSPAQSRAQAPASNSNRMLPQDAPTQVLRL